MSCSVTDVFGDVAESETRRDLITVHTVMSEDFKIVLPVITKKINATYLRCLEQSFDPDPLEDPSSLSSVIRRAGYLLSPKVMRIIIGILDYDFTFSEYIIPRSHEKVLETQRHEEAHERKMRVKRRFAEEMRKCVEELEKRVKVCHQCGKKGKYSTCNDCYFLPVVSKYQKLKEDLTEDGDVEPNPGPGRRRIRSVPVRRTTVPVRRKFKSQTRGKFANDKQMERNLLGFSTSRDLSYCDGSDQRNAVALNFFCWAMKLTDVWDPDPLLATGGITGFAEMAAFFLRFIVLWCKIKVSIANREPYPIHVGAVASPTSLVGSIGSRTQALDAFERPGKLFFQELSREQGMDRVQFERKLNPATILGNRQLYRGSGDRKSVV